MGSLLIRAIQREMARLLGGGLNRYNIVPPDRYHIREICWDGTQEGIVPPVVQGVLVAVDTGEEKSEFVQGLRAALNESGSPYQPFVLAWSAAHTSECDRKGGGGCVRCRARRALEDLRTRGRMAFGTSDAYHEAGHAVVGFSLGLEIEEVTLIPHGSGWGWVRVRYFESFCTEFVERQPKLARAYAVSLLAGPMSEARHSGRSAGELAEFSREDMGSYGGRRDLGQWELVARALQLDCTESEWWTQCRSEVLRRFEDPGISAAIALVSQRLQEARDFRSGELNRYLADLGLRVVLQSD